MSFALLSGWFLLGSLALFLVGLLLRRIPFGAVAPALGFALAVLMVLTAVFDNVMIAAGLFGYGDQSLLGIRVGLAPIEDFSYPLAAVLFMPALWWLGGGTAPARKDLP